jgi:hypothetical protein
MVVPACEGETEVEVFSVSVKLMMVVALLELFK